MGAYKTFRLCAALSNGSRNFYQHKCIVVWVTLQAAVFSEDKNIYSDLERGLRLMLALWETALRFVERNFGVKMNEKQVLAALRTKSSQSHPFPYIASWLKRVKHCFSTLHMSGQKVVITDAETEHRHRIILGWCGF